MFELYVSNLDYHQLLRIQIQILLHHLLERLPRYLLPNPHTIHQATVEVCEKNILNEPAVIGALKALQDKIRKLEQDRQIFEEANSKLEREAQSLREQRERERNEMIEKEQSILRESQLVGKSKEELLKEVEQKSQERQIVLEQTSQVQQNAMKSLREQIYSLERELMTEKMQSDIKHDVSKYASSQDFVPNFNSKLNYNKPQTVASPYVPPSNFETSSRAPPKPAASSNTKSTTAMHHSRPHHEHSQNLENRHSGVKRKQPSGDRPLVVRIPEIPFIVGKVSVVVK